MPDDDAKPDVAINQQPHQFNGVAEVPPMVCFVAPSGTGKTTMLMGRNQLAWFGADDAGPSLHQVASLFFSDVDIILVEGFRSAELPVIIVERDGHSDERWVAPDAERVLLRVAPDEVDRVVQLLEQRLAV